MVGNQLANEPSPFKRTGRWTDKPRSYPALSADIRSFAALGRIVKSAGYSEAAIREARGAQIMQSHNSADSPRHPKRLAVPTPLSTLIKLFALRAVVREEEARAAFFPLPVEEVEEMGLVESRLEGIQSCVGLSEFDGLLLAHDPHHENVNDFGSEYVPGINPTSVTLAGVTVRQPVHRALDLGTGCGLQALLAARHSERVIAVDANPRALNYAAFNAGLNGLTNIECRRGDLFGPVTDCRFDLIACNLPCVISPESRRAFHHSGLAGDTISEGIVRATPAYLSKGGFASILCNWTHGRDEHWSSPVQNWVEGAGCDAWLLRHDTHDPLTYAALWIRNRNTIEYERTLQRWVGYYQRLGIEAISAGVLTLRRQTPRLNWFRADELPVGSGTLQPWKN